MKKLKQANLLFLILFAIIFNSCIKPDSDHTWYLNRDFLSYFAFPKGSWWVYKEKNSGETDSFYVERYSVSTEYQKKMKANIEGFDYTIFSKYEKLYGGGRSHGGVYSSYEANNEYGASGYRFIYPPEYANRIDQCNCLLMKEHHDSIEINKKIYKDVFITENIDSLNGVQIKSEYFAKNVGIIKKTYFDGSEWELVKYHHAK